MKLSDKALTLAELLLAAAILAFVLSSLLLVFINCIILNESSRNLTLAYSALQARMEEIKNTASTNVGFFQLDDLNNQTFSSSAFPPGTFQGRIVVSGTDRLRTVTIFACFMSRNRLIGDSITNCQSSPAVRLVTQIAEP